MNHQSWLLSLLHWLILLVFWSSGWWGFWILKWVTETHTLVYGYIYIYIDLLWEIDIIWLFKLYIYTCIYLLVSDRMLNRISLMSTYILHRCSDRHRVPKKKNENRGTFRRNDLYFNENIREESSMVDLGGWFQKFIFVHRTWNGLFYFPTHVVLASAPRVCKDHVLGKSIAKTSRGSHRLNMIGPTI